jgi:uncharacterized membrane protein (UPF0127 family)
MLNSDSAKTKSALKPYYHPKLLLITGLVLVILLSVGAWMAFRDEAPAYQRLRADSSLTVAGRQFELQLANTSAERTRGLSGQQGMAADQGMLFVFDKAASQCFWMKDMQFSIDMIWLDASRRVTAVSDRVPPASYPQSFCANGQYVLELNAGLAAELGITPGKTLAWRTK